MRKNDGGVTPARYDAAAVARLAAWLREWELDRKLRAMALDAAPGRPLGGAAAAPPARWRPRGPATWCFFIHP